MACYVCGHAIEEHKDGSGPCEECEQSIGTSLCVEYEENEQDDEIEDQGLERLEAARQGQFLADSAVVFRAFGVTEAEFARALVFGQEGAPR